jgi:hypothetical protein
MHVSYIPENTEIPVEEYKPCILSINLQMKKLLEFCQLQSSMLVEPAINNAGVELDARPLESLSTAFQKIEGANALISSSIEENKASLESLNLQQLKGAKILKYVEAEYDKLQNDLKAIKNQKDSLIDGLDSGFLSKSLQMRSADQVMDRVLNMLFTMIYTGISMEQQNELLKNPNTKQKLKACQIPETCDLYTIEQGYSDSVKLVESTQDKTQYEQYLNLCSLFISERKNLDSIYIKQNSIEQVGLSLEKRRIAGHQFTNR